MPKSSIPQRALGKGLRIWRTTLKNFRLPLNVAIVGCGEISWDHIHAYCDCPFTRLVGISDIQPIALAKTRNVYRHLRTYRDYRQMLHELKPDIISVCTWPDSHANIVCDAAEAGVRGILCEKPLALRMDAIDRMCADCERMGTRLACGHQYRFHPCFVRTKELIEQGAIGSVIRVRGCIKSTLANNGPHLFDTVRYILGDPIVRQVTCECHRTTGSFNRGWPAEDAAAGTIEFINGTRFDYRTGEFSPQFFEISIEGDRGAITATPTQLLLNSIQVSLGKAVFEQCRNQQFREFALWVKGRQQTYRADAYAISPSIEAVLSAYFAASLEMAVKIPLADRGDVIRQLYSDTDTTKISRNSIPDRSSRQCRPIANSPRLAMDGGQPSVSRMFSCAPHMGLAEVTRLSKVVFSRQLCCVDGFEVRALEREFANIYGSESAVASTSGTAAIHTAIAALNPDPGDEIITTPMTDMGTILPILLWNCIPVFADIDPISGNLTPETISKCVTPRTRAAIVVHLFGRPAEIRPIQLMLHDRASGHYRL